MTQHSPEAISAHTARAVLGLDVSTTHLEPLSGGCIAPIYRVRAPDGDGYVIKVDPGSSGLLAVEAKMLDALRDANALPVPKVLHADHSTLVLEFIEHNGRTSEAGGVAFGRALAQLHAVRHDSYGFAHDTCVGPITLNNPAVTSWARFYRDHRLGPLVTATQDALPEAIRRDAHTLLSTIERAVDACGGSDGPSLVHGDLWSGNALWHAGSIAAVIDPAVSYAHPSTDLGMMRLFGGFPESTFTAYAQAAGNPAWLSGPGIALAQVWPALVHVRLFGSSYHAMLGDRLRVVLAAMGKSR